MESKPVGFQEEYRVENADFFLGLCCQSTIHGERGTTATKLDGRPDVSHLAKGGLETNLSLNLKILIATVLYKARNE